MCPDVVVECCGPGEGAPAVAALEGPVAGVRHDVVPQLRGLREGLRAVTTLVGPAVGRETATSVQETTWEGAPDLPNDFQRELRAHFSGSFLGSTNPKFHNLFNKSEILGQELQQSLWDLKTINQQTSEPALHICLPLFSQTQWYSLVTKKRSAHIGAEGLM